MSEAKYTPEEIIAKLQAHPKFGSQIKPITKHQSAIISSGLEPAVVIAGAGSGKTETMSTQNTSSTTDGPAGSLALDPRSATALKIYWHGSGCYCDHTRLRDDAECPVCDTWPKPEIRTMPNGCRYVS